MPDWLPPVLAALISGGGVLTMAKGWIALQESRHRRQREVRADEIAVLHRQINDLRTDREGAKVETKAIRDELAALVDEHTACRIALGAAHEREKHLTERVDQLGAEVAELRAEVAELRGA